ncbi:PAS domain-containing sensor histidine kinase [Massilia sp. ST3]|uniref:PAS domain-containing sensor histidine kinase n=1 Tax=Massilia sp. ST3 TaxID=2824903 RepID=UPI001B8295D7|nr:PAS domain-containing sensor histidine kinase [Massilia sp. ST3]MBQ5950330.1 PAS domain-containing sensor histidine kinase [Massilia sp. ST3]
MPTDSTRQDTFWTQRDADAFAELMLVKTRQYGVMFYDTDLRITGWNQGAAFITGWTADQVLGKPTGILFVPEDRERKLDEHEAHTAALVGVGEDERWHLRSDGSCFWASGVSVPLHRDEHGKVTGFVKIFRDATHLRARTRYLENELKDNVARQAERDVFIGTVAHEMRNPLSPLRSAQQLLQMFAGDAERSRQPLAVMDRQLGFLEKLIEDLVDLTRVQSGKLSISYEKIPLQVLLSEAVDSCRPAAQAQQISFHLSFPAVTIEVEVDSRRINQVFVNLINNAIKYNHPGGDVWLTATADQTHFVCYLKDNGKGIPSELQPKIFDVFTQAENTGAQRGEGLGIGLAVVKEIVSLHQGTVEVRSEGVGKGSEFIVRVPLQKPA